VTRLVEADGPTVRSGTVTSLWPNVGPLKLIL
jgi:hypothetical protein